MFFLVYFDKTDYKLIVFLPSKVRIHETSSGTQISLAMYTGSFQRYRGKRYFKFYLPFLSFPCSCCFWETAFLYHLFVVLMLIYASLPQSWVRGIWKKNGNIRITGATKIHHLQLLKVDEAGIKEKCMKWTTWQPSTVTCSRPGSFSKETWFWRFYDQIHIVLIFLIGW